MSEEDKAMQSFLQLNLQTPEKKPENAGTTQPANEEQKNLVVGKRLNRMANRAAHKAATVYGRKGSGLFSK
ncbi:MAG TPA: hypothetical protein VG844_09770 [Terracidiphilus sp.]|jgi:hypothetical protein|nr:hypothetical protein [Terracidiphilus sp.]